MQHSHAPRATPSSSSSATSRLRAERWLRTIPLLTAFLLALPSSLFAQFQAVGFDGSSVAVSGDEIYLAADGGPISAGAVHVFAQGAQGWSEVARIAPEGGEPGMGFGSWITVAGDRMLVGARESTHVYERIGGDWVEAAVFPSEAPVYGAAVSGDLAVLRTNSTYMVESSPLKVLRRSADGWVAAGAIAASGDDLEAGHFGASVAVIDDVIAVGAPFAGGTSDAEGESNPGPGAVHFYREGVEGWEAAGDPITPRGSAPSSFGAGLESAAGPQGTHLFVSSWSGWDQGPAVAEFVHDSESGEWTEMFNFGAPVLDSRRPGNLSPVVTVVGDELWIGGMSPGPRGEGQVLRYAVAEAGGWMLNGVLAPTVLEPRGGFGGRLAVEGAVAAVEAPGRYNRTGAVHVFEQVNDEWMETGELSVETPNYAAINGATTCENGSSAAFGCSEMDILSFVPVRELGADRGIRANDVWGWTDPETDREYALVGLSNATSFVDITDPEAPRYLGRMMMPEGANSSAWRDIKVYENHAFVVSDGAGPHGMQVFDLTRLRDDVSEPQEFEPDAHYADIASAHNIIINEATGFAYTVGGSSGGETCGGGLHMIDIRAPTNPTFAGCFQHEGTGRRGTGGSHDAMCIVYAGPDEDYSGRELCFGSNETAISIADVTDKANPAPIAQATYPNVAYAHQGWITDDHRYFYLGDEGDEGSQTRAGTPFPGTRTLIWDMTDLDDPIFVGEHFGETPSTDHNMYVVGDLLYQSNYTSGLRVLDISDPENPREVGFLDTVPYDDGVSMSGSWSNYPYFRSGTIIVTSGSEGLFMVRYRKPIT